MTRKAILYARVSTDGQAEHGTSLQSQIEGCRRYALAHSFDILAEITDDCSGTIPIVERPGGKALYNYLDQGEVTAVILYTHDRTARDEKVIEYILFKSSLFDRGIELHYSDTGLDPYTMEGNLVGYIKAYGATEERRKIRERTNRGKLKKAQSGKWMGTRPPYGYRKVGEGREARLEIDPAEAEVVRRIYDIYLGRNGRNRWNMIGIAVLLTAEKVPLSGRGRKSAKGWTDGTIRYILTNRAYIGEFRFNDVPMAFPDLAILDKETFDAAQLRRVENSQQNKRARKHEYLLAGGFFHCSCGCAMIGRVTYNKRKGSERYFYYYCANNGRQYLTDCRERGVRREMADSLVWEWVYNLLTNSESLEAGLSHMIEQRELGLAPKRERLATINRLYGDLERQAGALIEALREATHEMVSATIRNQLKDVGNQLAGLDKERGRLQAELEIGAWSDEELEVIRGVGREVCGLLDNADMDTKREILERLGVRVVLGRDGEERVLGVSCGLGFALNISLSGEANANRQVVFSTIIPLK